VGTDVDKQAECHCVWFCSRCHFFHRLCCQWSRRHRRCDCQTLAHARLSISALRVTAAKFQVRSHFRVFITLLNTSPFTPGIFSRARSLLSPERGCRRSSSSLPWGRMLVIQQYLLPVCTGLCSVSARYSRGSTEVWLGYSRGARKKTHCDSKTDYRYR